MAGVIGLIVLVGLLALNYCLISSMTSGIANRKLRSLIMSVSNFVLVLLFVISLPVVGGYSYDSFQDMLEVLFDEETATILTITIIGFLIAIFYFAAGAYSIWEEEKKKAKIEAEKRRIANLTDNISQLVNRYRPKEVMWIPFGKSPGFKSELVNQDVVASVRQHKRNLSDLIGRYREVNSRISNILECSGIEVLEHQLEYLQMNEMKLSALKSESDQIYRDITSRKIQLLNEDSYVSNILHKAFELLKTSKKCISERISIADFIVERKPRDLDQFLYQCSPVILLLDNTYYCLFSHVILVFDDNGRFSTALDPTAINISVERKTANVYVSDNSRSLSHKYVDTDSKKVQEGQTTSQWLYSNKDGSPDMRRTHNPLIRSRTDIYEYGEVTIDIAGSAIVFTVSSQAAIERLPYAGIEYSQKHNHLHNPTSDLIILLKHMLGSGDDEIACELEKAYGNMQKSENYFCKEVSV